MAFVDFQGLQPTHLARDIWYYLYASTDSKWRKDNLEIVLFTYYQSIHLYLEKAGINVSFNELKAEMNKEREFGFLFAFLCIPVMLNPYPDYGFSSYGQMMKYFKWRDETYSKPIKDDEHENVKEINRRMLDVVEEAFAIGLIK